MSFYCIYLVEGIVELHALEQEDVAIAQKGRLISTQKGYQPSWEHATALAKKKQLPLVDRSQPTASKAV